MNLIHEQVPHLPLTNVVLVLPRTGVCLDPPQKQGLTHVLTQLMLRGAGGLSQAELHEQLERLGASISCGIQSDHSTWSLSTLSENAGASLRLFQSTLVEPNLEQGELDSLKRELISTWIHNREENKFSRAQDIYFRQLFCGGEQGFSTDGTLAGLRNISLDDVRSHYENQFKGSPPLLGILSNHPLEQVEDSIAGKLALPVSAPLAHHPWDDFVPTHSEGRAVTIISDPDSNTDEILMGGFVANEVEAGWPVQRLGALILGGDMNSRLFRTLRADKGFSYGANCWFESEQGRVPRNCLSPFSCHTFPAAEHTAEALPLLLELYEEFTANGPTEQELALAQATLVNSHVFKSDQPQKILSARIEEALYGVPLDSQAENQRKLAAVSTAEMRETLRATHDPGRLSMVLLGDPERLEPAVKTLSGVSRVEVIAYPEA